MVKSWIQWWWDKSLIYRWFVNNPLFAITCSLSATPFNRLTLWQGTGYDDDDGDDDYSDNGDDGDSGGDGEGGDGDVDGDGDDGFRLT